MSDITFSISELIQDAWSKFKEKPGFWILITIISIAVGYFGDYGLSIDPESFEASFYFNSRIVNERYKFIFKCFYNIDIYQIYAW